MATAPETQTQEPEQDAAPREVTVYGRGRRPRRGTRRVPPKLADGIELLGEYEDSGFKEPHYIARRADGQVIQLSRLMHLVAESADGQRSEAQIAERVTDELGRTVSPDNVVFLVEKKLRPLGVLAQADGTSPELQKADPLLALKFRAALVPEGVTRALTTIFYPLFYPPVVLAAIAGLVAVDFWFFFVHGGAQPVRQLIYNPVLLLMVLGLVVVATAFHEIGHATALRYGGGRPGVMGAGIYIVWPAFYTDVTDAYRLGRGARLRTDLGGVYFNALFVLAIAGIYAVTRWEPILVLVIIQHMQIVQQLLPFLRLDGYYILSDLTGVPDMFQRIKPTLKSAVPGKETEDEVKVLKPWVRVVTTTWILLLIPVVLFMFAMLAFNAPRMIATAWDSLWLQVDKVRDGGTLGIVSGAIQSIALVLPLAGMTYTFSRLGARIASGAWSWSGGSAVRRGVVAAVTAAMVATTAYVLLPNGDYRPIQPGEKGTIQGGLAQLENVSSGRPALTEERTEELDGAPTERSQRGIGPSESEEDDTTPSSDSEDPDQPKQTPQGSDDDAPAQTTEEPAPTQQTETAEPTETSQPTDTTDTTSTTETTTTTP